MVDCGGLRCAQERRSFKKELLSWAKKIPVLIGLEAVALEIGGHELVSQLLEPFSCLETDEITDWEPEENCFYCNTKITDPGSELNEDGTKKIHSGFKCTPELMPYCPQYYTQNAQMDSSQQPLDLSSNGCLDSVPSPGSAWELDLVSKPHVELKIPQITMQAGKCKKDTHIQNGKKAYTEEELVTAVTEIRSGKLGTRRAAVLYGIPRSTLRNKIFKMETEEQQQSAVVINTEHECSEDSQHSDGAISHLQRAIMAGASDPLHLSPYSMLFPPLVGGILSCQQDFGPQTEDDWEKRLEQIRRKHNLNGAAINLAEKPLPLTANNGKNSNSTCPEFKLPLLHDLVRKMTEQRLLIEQSASQIRSPVALESLRHQQEGINHHSNGISSSSNQPTDSPSSYTLMSLKIPSYRPAKAQNQPETVNSTTLAPSSNDMTEERPYDSMKIGEALKDIIVKTISEKVYKRKHQADSYSSTQDENHPGNNNNNCKSYSSDLMATGSAMPPAKKLKKSGGEKKLENNSTTNNTITNNNNNNNNNNMDGGNKPVKKTRPKRGQYRKYNSQLLMEAVRAVQRGEMSVHRAGSYYGVPHSTLEYKVKERHLLRQKKIKESQIQKDSSNTGSSSGVSLEDSGGTKTASHTSGSATSSRGSSGNNGNNNKNNNNNSSNNNNNNNNNTNNNNNNNSKNNNSNNNTTNNNSSSKSNVVSASSSSSSSSTNSGNVKSEKSSSASNAGNGKNTGSKFECKSLNSPWLQPYTNGSPQYDASGMNLFTSSFALSTPASELLRKLQHKVQSKSNAFAQDSNFLSGALNRQNGMSPLGNSFLFIN